MRLQPKHFTNILGIHVCIGKLPDVNFGGHLSDMSEMVERLTHHRILT